MEQKAGAIQKIVEQHTAYQNGGYRYYPPVTGLVHMIQRIIESKSTPNYLRLNPFYMNSKSEYQIEYEDYRFYLECRETFDEAELKQHIGDCFDKTYDEMNSEEIRLGHICFPLCVHGDTEAFKRALEKYVEVLDELLPKLLERSIRDMELSDQDAAFGHFCFEVDAE